jgi:hypothetical protein
VAWAYDDGDEQIRWLVRPAGGARREAQRVAGPDAYVRRARVAAGHERSDARASGARAGYRRPTGLVATAGGGGASAELGEGTIEPEGRRHAQRGTVHEERGPGLAGETPKAWCGRREKTDDGEDAGDGTMTVDSKPTRGSFMNVGEQLVSSYLRYIRKCDFIQTNLYTVDVQGEIDVVGINLAERKVYVCEVAIHLTTGLQYVKDKRPNNVNKLVEKFTRDIAYARKYLADYEHHFMLWSPIVKEGNPNPVYDQVGHLSEVKNRIRASTQVELECVVNAAFYSAMQEMREFASRQTAELQCPLMRLLQIEELLGRHVGRSGVVS